jgi:hypothetical protein
MRAALAQWSGLPVSSPVPATADPTTAIASAPTVVGVAANLAHAPTVASHPPPAAVATPMVVHHTPAPPTPVVPYAPASMPDAVAAKRKNRMVIILAVLGTLSLYKVVDLIKSRDSKQQPSARADDSAAAEFGQSVARSATSMGLNAAAQALGVAPTASSAPPLVTASAIASANPTASATVATVTAPTKKKRYGGKEGWKAGGDFSGCPTCDWKAFYNDMGMRVADTSACFAASEYEPPLHENPYYWMSVDESGHLSMTNAPGGAPSLDRCLLKVMQSVGVKGGPGTFKVGFQGECQRGCNNCCD